MTIDDDLDGDGFWAIEDVDTHAYINYFEPNPKMSDMKSDTDDKASCTKLTGAEDEHALDWFGSDDQLVTEGENSDIKEEANAATLEEEDTPRSEALPIPHHALHVPVISHTLVFSGELDKEGHAFQIVTTCRECIAERQNQMLLKLLWVLWHIIQIWLLKLLWGAALQLTILSKHTFEVLYWTSPVEEKV
jgi:hypothetical protein